MSNNLYDILDEFRQLEQELIEAGGELTPELEERLAINQDEFETKMDNYAKLRIEKLTRIENINSEIERLSAIRANEFKVAQRLEERMEEALLQYGATDKKGIKRFSTMIFNFSTRKSTGYKYNESIIPSKYWRTPPPVEPVPVLDKDAIKTDLKANIPVEGVEVTTNYSITIK